MSMTVKDVIRWLQTLPADDAIYIDEGGLSLVSEKDGEAYLEVGGQHMEEETEDDEEDDEIFEDEEEDENFEDIDDYDEDEGEEDWDDDEED
jgi:hypothetical protein